MASTTPNGLRHAQVCENKWGENYGRDLFASVCGWGCLFIRSAVIVVSRPAVINDVGAHHGTVVRSGRGPGIEQRVVVGVGDDGRDA